MQRASQDAMAADKTVTLSQSALDRTVLVVKNIQQSPRSSVCYASATILCAIANLNWQHNKQLRTPD